MKIETKTDPWVIVSDFAFAALTILLYSCLFPPMGISWLAYCALVPWLIMVSRTTTKSQLIVSYSAGLVFFLVNTHWIYPITIPGYISMCVYLGLYWPLAGWLIQRLNRRFSIPFFISASLSWTCCEFIRSLGPLGFAWFFLGHSQVKNLAMIQIADIAGAYAVTFVLMLINGAIAQILLQVKSRKSAACWCLVPTAVITIATLIYGQWRLKQNTLTAGPKLAVVQEDFLMAIDSEPPSLTDLFMTHLNSSIMAAEEHPDIIVWPETCISVSINPEFLEAKVDKDSLKMEQDSAKDIVAMITKFTREAKSQLILGSISQQINPPDHYPPIDNFNSALIFGSNGKYRGRYDKIRLVPFGEYVPFRFTFPKLYRFLNDNMTPFGADGYEYTLTAGTKLKRFRVSAHDKEFRYAVAICYEDTMSDLIRGFVSPKDNTKQIDFLINISNDGWFNHSSELPQHFNICAFRAVENRIPIARSVNTGISGFITSTGRMEKIVGGSVASYGPGVRGFSVNELAIDSRISFYSRIGDYPIFILTILIFLAAIISRWIPERSKNEE